ncbi:hypothetical protein ACFQ1S_13910, partial [Kibdelosporangium lantanae]
MSRTIVSLFLALSAVVCVPALPAAADVDVWTGTDLTVGRGAPQVFERIFGDLHGERLNVASHLGIEHGHGTPLREPTTEIADPATNRVARRTRPGHHQSGRPKCAFAPVEHPGRTVGSTPHRARDGGYTRRVKTSSQAQTLLGIYLNDHLAGAVAGTDLADVVARLSNAEEQVHEWLEGEPDLAEVAFVFTTAVLEGATYLSVADAAVTLYRQIGSASGVLTPRYLRSLRGRRDWITFDGQVLRFKHA